MAWIRVLALAASLLAGLASAQSVPAERDTPYLGPIAIEVDATDVDHRILQVVETIPVRPGPRWSCSTPEWIPGAHSPINQVKRLAGGLRISAAGKSVAWQRDSANLHAFRCRRPGGRLVARDQLPAPSLPCRDDSYSSVLTSRIAAVDFRGAVLYPAGHDVSRIDVDAQRPPSRLAGATRPRCGPISEADGWVKYARSSRSRRSSIPRSTPAAIRAASISMPARAGR
jgi:hypothetical protein